MAKKYFFVGLGLIIIYFLGSVIINEVFLLDDLSILGVDMREIIHHPNFTSRPISGIATGILTHMSKYSSYFLYLAYVGLILSFVFVYKTLKVYTKNTEFSVLGTLVYVILPIASSTFYSPIMINSSIAVIFYCMSLIYIYIYIY